MPWMQAEKKKKEAVNTRAASTGVFFGLSLEARSVPFTCAATCCVPGRQRRSPGSVPLCPPHPPLSHARATPQTLRFAAAPAGTEQKRCSCRERAPGLPPPLRSVLDASASPRMLHLERSRKISFRVITCPASGRVYHPRKSGPQAGHRRLADTLRPLRAEP